MALTFLVDTSVVKRLGRSKVRAVVEPLALAGQLARTGIGDLEVGHSARTAQEWDELLVAVAAEEHRLAVLHYDRDFDLISEVTGLVCRWVVPPGTVD
jgi:predicted nucleic acid-binding protein